MRAFARLFALCSLSLLSVAHRACADDADSVPSLSRPDVSRLMDDTAAPPVVRSPGRALVLSLVPGGGMFYDRKPLRGALYLGAFGIAGGLGANRLWFAANVDADGADKRERSRDSVFALLNAAADTSLQKSLSVLLLQADADLALARYDMDATRRLGVVGLGWAGGIWYMSALDALDKTGAFADNRPRRPGVAAALSAVPFLSLGQWYNRSLAKAGMVTAVQTMLALAAWQQESLRRTAVDERALLVDARKSGTAGLDSRIGEWDSRYTGAFRHRNTLLWYLTISYFYGIFDAAVDAHLHDRESKVKVFPTASLDGPALRLTYDF